MRRSDPLPASPPEPPLPHSQFTLLGKRRFAPFFITQFLGAFNDNAFKNALVVLLTFHTGSWTTLAPGLLANLAAGIFILPFFLFSASAGQLADKYDRARLARLVKLLEIVVMLVAGLGFALHSLALLLTALFLLGGHSTLFGPVKYALLPQHLRSDELIGGNALVEAGTFVAILLGALAGSLLAAFDGSSVPVTLCSLAIALLGYASSRHIPPAPAPMPTLRIDRNPFAATWRNIASARQNRPVFLAIVGISWFWMYGALFLAQFPAIAKSILHGDETAVTLLLATFTVGIGVGSLLCERLSGHRLELGLVPIGAAGLTLFGLDFAAASATLLADAGGTASLLPLATLLADGKVWRLLADLLLLGGFGGLYCVPLYTLLQQRSDERQRARSIAANNIMNALYMVGGAAAAAALLGQGLSLPMLFGVAALINALVAVYLIGSQPEYRQRLQGLWARHH